MTQQVDVNQTTTGRAPNFIAWHVTEAKGDKKGFWTRVGAAWGHKDGKGLTLELELLPVGSGKITLRVPDPKDEKGAGA